MMLVAVCCGDFADRLLHFEVGILLAPLFIRYAVPEA